MKELYFSETIVKTEPIDKTDFASSTHENDADIKNDEKLENMNLSMNPV